MSTLKVTNIQNSSGGNTSTADEIYSGRAKAWVNFDGTTGSGTGFSDITIYSSFNVDSITDNGGGLYTLNFTNSMPDANYVVIGTTGTRTGSPPTNGSGSAVGLILNINATTSNFDFGTIDRNTSALDAERVNIAVFH